MQLTVGQDANQPTLGLLPELTCRSEYKTQSHPPLPHSPKVQQCLAQGAANRVKHSIEHLRRMAGGQAGSRTSSLM